MDEWKKIIFYAIVPAMIAGIFAVAPKLYEMLTAPTAELNYQVTRGPILSEESVQKSIYAIDVRNDGKKPLSGVYSELQTESNIEAVSTYQNTALAPVVETNQRPYSVSVETLHPGESFSISVMVASEETEPSIDFVLRSKEALGKNITSTSSESAGPIDFASGILAGVSVFVMSLLLFRRIKKGIAFPTILYKPDILFYIAARLKFTEIVDKYQLDEGSVTYLRFSDLLLSIGLSGDAQQNKKAILGLKSMLLIYHVADQSRELIERNIRMLEGNDFSQDEINMIKQKAGRLDDQSALRDLIDEYISDPSAFLSKSDESPNDAIQSSA